MQPVHPQQRHEEARGCCFHVLSPQHGTARCPAEGTAQERRGLLRGSVLRFLGFREIKIRVPRRFPGEIVPRVLYLGDWADAEAHERLDELNVKRHGSHHSIWETCMPAPGTTLHACALAGSETLIHKDFVS